MTIIVTDENGRASLIRNHQVSQNPKLKFPCINTLDRSRQPDRDGSYKLVVTRVDLSAPSTWTFFAFGANMQYLRPGNLIATVDNRLYFNFLVLSKSAFFGCQWAYAFHLTSTSLLPSETILDSFGQGFHALIDFIEERRENTIIKRDKISDTARFENTLNLKARIDQYGGGHLWYIYSKGFQILEKRKRLKRSQYQFPIATGMNCRDSYGLIRNRWDPSQFVKDEGGGQFPQIRK